MFYLYIIKKLSFDQRRVYIYVFRTYIEQGARKKVLLSDKAYNRMRNERERPHSPTLHEIQTHLAPQLETTFKRFSKVLVV